MSPKQRVAIIGCGQIGQKRAQALDDNARVSVCCDLSLARAEKLAQQTSASRIEEHWQSAVSDPEVDVVFVCATHNLLAEIAYGAVSHGKHVLIEKPGACQACELNPVHVRAAETGALVRIGFNHRYHRAFQLARNIIDSGVIADLLFIRARYGHGGRIGYDTEWRANPLISGGGEAIDQGVHLIDLARWFIGDLHWVGGLAPTYFWNMPVEDNAFFLLQTQLGQAVSLHASWTEWKNLFSFEICGRLGKLEISGLGGSYGVERLTHYQMSAKMGPPETTIYEFPMADNSWVLETADFLTDIRLGRAPTPGIVDAQAALRIVERLYAGRAS